MSTYIRQYYLTVMSWAVTHHITDKYLTKFMKSKHVKRKVTEVGGNYVISYSFKDHKNQLRNFKANYPIRDTDKKTLQFGVPKSMLEPYYDTPEVRAKRKNQMKTGMFKIQGNALIPNHNRMATYYKGFTKPIANFARKVLGSTATQHEVTEFLLRFCQDIPYGVPPTNLNGKYIGQMDLILIDI